MDDCNKRRHPRVDLSRPAKLVDHDGREADITILDVSKSGIRIACSEPLLPGDRVQILVDADQVFHAVIKWAMGDEAGGIFISRVKLDD